MDFNLNNVLSILDKNRKKKLFERYIFNNYCLRQFYKYFLWQMNENNLKLNLHKNNNDYQLQTAITNQFVIKINQYYFVFFFHFLFNHNVHFKYNLI